MRQVGMKQQFSKIFVSSRNFKETICFPQKNLHKYLFSRNFSKNMCQAGSNARGNLKKVAVFANVRIILTTIFSFARTKFRQTRQNFAFCENEKGHFRFNTNGKIPLAYYSASVLLQQKHE
jgi:hypothetical protein